MQTEQLQQRVLDEKGNWIQRAAPVDHSNTQKLKDLAERVDKLEALLAIQGEAINSLFALEEERKLAQESMKSGGSKKKVSAKK